MAYKKHAGGAPPKYKSVEEMQEKIDAYFKSCEGELVTDADGKAIVNKYGEPVYIGRKPPTVTGLALALGFANRRSLSEYQDKKEFMLTVTRAKARCEQYAEERLYDRDGTGGAQFSLKCNFGWNEKPDSSESDGVVSELIQALKDGTRMND